MATTETPLEYAMRRKRECDAAAEAWARVNAALWERVQSIPEGADRDAWASLARDASRIAAQCRASATTADAFLAFEHVISAEATARRVGALIHTLDTE